MKLTKALLAAFKSIYFLALFTCIVVLLIGGAASVAVYLNVGNIGEKMREFPTITTKKPSVWRLSLLMRGCPAPTEKDVAVKRNPPIDQPPSDEEVLKWVSSTPLHIMDFGYYNFYDKLLAAKDKFSFSGWCGFMSALQSSHMLEGLVKDDVSLSMVANGPPVLLKRLFHDGFLSWVTIMPATIKFQSETNTPPEDMPIQLYLDTIYEPNGNNPDNLAIRLWIAAPADTDIGAITKSEK